MSKLFLGGIPTTPDVKRLREAFKLETGLVIKHEDIEIIIECEWKTVRYRTITDAWRRDLFNQDNIVLDAVHGVGFKVLSGPERVHKEYEGFKRGIRKQARSLRRASVIKDDTLSEFERKKRDHLLRLGAIAIHAGKEVSKKIEPPKVAAQISQLRKENK